MNKEVSFSTVPVGDKFEYKGQIYSRFTYERGKQMIDGRPAFTHFPKHRMVNWLNAYPSHIEA